MSCLGQWVARPDRPGATRGHPPDRMSLLWGIARDPRGLVDPTAGLHRGLSGLLSADHPHDHGRWRRLHTRRRQLRGGIALWGLEVGFKTSGSAGPQACPPGFETSCRPSGAAVWMPPTRRLRTLASYREAPGDSPSASPLGGPGQTPAARHRKTLAIEGLAPWPRSLGACARGARCRRAFR